VGLITPPRVRIPASPPVSCVALVAQWIERLVADQKAAGSNPAEGTGGGDSETLLHLSLLGAEPWRCVHRHRPRRARPWPTDPRPSRCWRPPDWFHRVTPRSLQSQLCVCLPSVSSTQHRRVARDDAVLPRRLVAVEAQEHWLKYAVDAHTLGHRRCTNPVLGLPPAYGKGPEDMEGNSRNLTIYHYCLN
jgi:hypothetical protein